MRQWIGSLALLMTVIAASAQGGASLSVGPMSGEVTSDSAVLWARADGAGTLLFEVSSNADLTDAQTLEVVLDEAGDFIAEARVGDLTADTAYYYRASIGASSASGTFTTSPAPDSAAALRFTFASCIGGQGYCRPADGWKIFETMGAQSPDFFLITGDTVYSTNACPIDRNVEGAEAPANTLPEFRSRYRYQLGDTPYSDFLANTPVYVTWDDHEIADNFAGIQMSALNPERYAAGRQAFFEYWPVQENLGDEQYRLYRDFEYGAHAGFFMLDTRSYRDPIVNWDTTPRTGAPKTMLGAAQNAWLRENLLTSETTWKFIVSSVPLGYATGFPQPQVDGRDGWADNGEPSGYESELMSLLYFIEANDIENVIFLTGDSHWPYALSYDPDRDGTPNFYELSASPLSAIPLAPGVVDQTFNPTVLYAEGEFQGDLFNFGQIDINLDGALTFQIIDREGVQHYELTLQP